MAYTQSTTQGNTAMELKSAKHKAIKAMLNGDRAPKGIGERDAKKVRHMLSVLSAAKTLQEVSASFPGWRLHPLSGPMQGHWSLDVTGNWRLTFRMDRPGEITELDFRDTH